MEEKHGRLKSQDLTSKPLKQTTLVLYCSDEGLTLETSASSFLTVLPHQLSLKNMLTARKSSCCLVKSSNSSRVVCVFCKILLRLTLVLIAFRTYA